MTHADKPIAAGTLNRIRFSVILRVGGGVKEDPPYAFMEGTHSGVTSGSIHCALARTDMSISRE